MASDDSKKTETASLPFGAMERPDESATGASAKTGRRRRRGGRRSSGEHSNEPRERDETSRNGARDDASPRGEGGGDKPANHAGQANQGDGEPRKSRRRRGGRRRRKNRGEGQEGEGGGDGQRAQQQQRQQRSGGQGERSQSDQEGKVKLPGEGMFVAEKGGYGTLRSRESNYASTKQDIFVPQRLIQKYRLSDGAIVSGPLGKGKKHKFQLNDVVTVDGKSPRELANLVAFKNLTTIDPDFHYALGDATGDVTMRVLDIIAPIGRGQRALIVAPPRTGKTTILRQFAKGIEETYPDVHLVVLLVDERPEEATDWQRSVKGDVFVSTSDEMPKRHVQLAEAVWKRCQRLVELGEEVVLLLDSITRLARAYNNFSAGTGRTMSGGLDSRAMERPRQIFGSARNTEKAGSLTILGTTLVDTGSRMDQLIFEEFKGTGNSEIVLNRKLADRRIFPAIDIERSGTRKEEKLLGKTKLRRINTMRRVLLKMNFMEAMELLITKLEDVEKNDDFLQRFDVDPEA
ncbi:MAG: transcription termination factor Rho [Planctomycetes bacterium]|nr:transcription termination factor Rho [Planctomycetota bacterium]MCB9905383.1 transcription termination factor Rho [Planctomycetota bacterium]